MHRRLIRDCAEPTDHLQVSWSPKTNLFIAAADRGTTAVVELDLEGAERLARTLIEYMHSRVAELGESGALCD